jgi:hypothetical protein
MYKFIVILLFAVGVSLTPTANLAQISSQTFTVIATPAIDSLNFDPNTGVLQVYASGIATNYTYSIESIYPNTVAIPSPNHTGIFDVYGAESVIVKVENTGCNITYYAVIDDGSSLSTSFLSFNARLVEEYKGLLNWKVNSSDEAAYYKIEKSANSVSFLPIDSINTNSINTYDYIDTNLYIGLNYYRIVQVNKDGSNVVSETRSLPYYPHQKVLYKLYPNPASDYIKLDYTSYLEEMLQYWIVDNHSRLMMTPKSYSLQIGNNTINIDISHLSDGPYYIMFNTLKDPIIKQSKFIKRTK